MEDSIKKFVGCDMHKKYSVFVSMDQKGGTSESVRVIHNRESVREFINKLPERCQIAVETVGNWYWMVDEIESCGHVPLLTHARKAKLMMGQINKTDKLDATGLAKLLRNGTLPTVWIPPKDLRDLRELCRYRMCLSHTRTRLKNRIHATLAKYAIVITEVSDLFGIKGRELLCERVVELPPETQRCVGEELELLDTVQTQIDGVETRIDELAKETPEMALLKTIPCVGKVFAAVIYLEVGSVERFPGSARLASYCGTVPRVISSGGKTYYGHTNHEVNRYLKWAFVEVANNIVKHRKYMGQRHVLRLYERIKQRKGHGKAVVAVARHLAEATWWILRDREPYRDPKYNDVSSTHRQTRARSAQE